MWDDDLWLTCKASLKVSVRLGTVEVWAKGRRGQEPESFLLYTLLWGRLSIVISLQAAASQVVVYSRRTVLIIRNIGIKTETFPGALINTL